MEATATIKLVDQGQADVGFPSPGVFSLGLEQGIPLVSVWHMGAYDVFSFAFRKGEKPAAVSDLAGKTILLGSAGWQSIVDPMLAQAGRRPGERQLRRGRQPLGPGADAGPGRRGAVLGGPARAVDRPGPRLRLHPADRVLEVSRPTAS